MNLIYFLRHGQTALNASDGNEVLRGQRSDIEIEWEGQRQALNQGEFLKPRKVTRLYSSPVRRALQTAQLVSQVINVPVVQDELATDWDIGEWSGQPAEPLKAQMALYQGELRGKAPPGGEPAADFIERVRAFYERVLGEARRGETIAVVTHNRVISTLPHIFGRVDAPLPKSPVLPGGIYEINPTTPLQERVVL